MEFEAELAFCKDQIREKLQKKDIPERQGNQRVK